MPMRKHFVGPWKKWRLSHNGLSLYARRTYAERKRNVTDDAI